MCACRARPRPSEGTAVVHTDTLTLRRPRRHRQHQERRAHRFRGAHSDRARPECEFERAHDALRIEGQWPLPSLRLSRCSRCALLGRAARSPPHSRTQQADHARRAILRSWICQEQQSDISQGADRAGYYVDFRRPGAGHAAWTSTTAIWVFRGNVKITMDQGQLTSDEAEITFRQETALQGRRQRQARRHSSSTSPKPESWPRGTPTPSTTTWPRAWCISPRTPG